MLYVTTRNKVDSFTAHHVLCHDRSSDGGFFVPLRLPVFSAAELDSFVEKSFGQSVADVMNRFFTSRLDGWDVDFCIGRFPVRLVPLNQKIYIAEAWHNPDRQFERLARNLCCRIRGDKENAAPTEWARTAVRIAILFAVYGQMRKLGALNQGQAMDISVCADDFEAPMAIWYAREMGLPVGTIICTCCDSSRLWDFLHHGSLQIDPQSHAGNTADGGQSVVRGLERLIFAVFGYEETKRYLQTCECGGTYTLNDLRLKQLFRGIRASVVSDRRAASVIRSTYGSAAYLLDPNSALAFGGLQDIRTEAGEARASVIVSERSPAHFLETLSKAAGIPVEELCGRFGSA